MFDIQFLQAWAIGLLPWALGFLVLMVLDCITGALLAWYQGYFKFEELPRFLQTGVLYFWAWLTAEAVAALPLVLQFELTGYADAFAEIAPKAVYFVVAVTKYGGSIRNNIKQILEQRNNKPWGPEEETYLIYGVEGVTSTNPIQKNDDATYTKNP